MYVLRLASEAYGVEEFNYDSIEELLEGLGRMVRSCESATDGVKRTLLVTIEADEMDEEDLTDE